MSGLPGPVKGPPLKGITRRQFLFGGGKNSEPAILPTVIGLGATGLAIVGWGSPGPSAQSFQNAYVQKKPTVQQIVEATASLSRPFRVQAAPGFQGYVEFGAADAGETTIGINDLEGGGAPAIFLQVTDVLTGLTLDLFDYDPISKSVIVGHYGDNVVPKIMRLRASSSILDPTSFGFNVESELGIGAAAALAGSGATIGPPAGLVGTLPNTLSFGGHRHAFSGRFQFAAFIYDGAEGGAVPVLYETTDTLATAITIRRITVRALTAPVGGGDTFDINNGTIGLAVTLGAGAVVATATGIVNMAATTLPVIRHTAKAPTTPATRVNISVIYTMNI